MCEDPGPPGGDGRLRGSRARPVGSAGWTPVAVVRGGAGHVVGARRQEEGAAWGVSEKRPAA